MIKLIAHNEQEDGFDTEMHIEGDGYTVAQQLTAIFDRIYEASPLLFETALINCKYVEIIHDII